MKRHGVHSRTCEVKTAHCRRAPTLRFLKREAEIAKHTLVSEGEEAALLGAGICTALALRTPKINNQTKAGVGGGRHTGGQTAEEPSCATRRDTACCGAAGKGSSSNSAALRTRNSGAPQGYTQKELGRHMLLWTVSHFLLTGLSSCGSPFYLQSRVGQTANPP